MLLKHCKSRGFITDILMEVLKLHHNSIANDITDKHNKSIYEKVANDITSKGYCIAAFALPLELSHGLLEQVKSISEDDFIEAGIGRQRQHMQNEFVRRDEICWINDSSDASRAWLKWTADLQTYLNEHLFLGLFSFESHFARYAAGSFYKRHMDAFKGEANRVLSVVAYLNPDWQIDDGGELVVYRDKADIDGLKVVPALGTIAIFLSEEFPHEVLTTQRDRYSIAGWYRLNGSKTSRVDPPR